MADVIFTIFAGVTNHYPLLAAFSYSMAPRTFFSGNLVHVHPRFCLLSLEFCFDHPSIPFTLFCPLAFFRLSRLSWRSPFALDSSVRRSEPSRFTFRKPFPVFFVPTIPQPCDFFFLDDIVYVRRMHSRIIQLCSKVAWWLIWFTGETRGASYMQWSEYQDQIARSVSLGDRVTRR